MVSPRRSSPITAACLLAAATLCAGCAAPPHSPGESHNELRHAVLHVTLNGAWHDRIASDESPALCAAFRLSEAQATGFFRQARRVSEAHYQHELEGSRCVVRGEAHWPQGLVTHWQIDLAGRAWITQPNGETLYLYRHGEPGPR